MMELTELRPSLPVVADKERSHSTQVCQATKTILTARLAGSIANGCVPVADDLSLLVNSDLRDPAIGKLASRDSQILICLGKVHIHHAIPLPPEARDV